MSIKAQNSSLEKGRVQDTTQTSVPTMTSSDLILGLNERHLKLKSDMNRIKNLIQKQAGRSPLYQIVSQNNGKVQIYSDHHDDSEFIIINGGVTSKQNNLNKTQKNSSSPGNQNLQRETMLNHLENYNIKITQQNDDIRSNKQSRQGGRLATTGGTALSTQVPSTVQNRAISNITNIPNSEISNHQVKEGRYSTTKHSKPVNSLHYNQMVDEKENHNYLQDVRVHQMSDNGNVNSKARGNLNYLAQPKAIEVQLSLQSMIPTNQTDSKNNFRQSKNIDEPGIQTNDTCQIENMSATTQQNHQYFQNYLLQSAVANQSKSADKSEPKAPKLSGSKYDTPSHNQIPSQKYSAFREVQYSSIPVQSITRGGSQIYNKSLTDLKPATSAATMVDDGTQFSQLRTNESLFSSTMQPISYQRTNEQYMNFSQHLNSEVVCPQNNSSITAWIESISNAGTNIIDFDNLQLSSGKIPLKSSKKSREEGLLKQIEELENKEVQSEYLVQKLREIVHNLQLRDASQRLEISKLQKLNQEKAQKQQQSENQIKSLQQQISQDNDYILKLDNQLTSLQIKLDNYQRNQNAQCHQEVKIIHSPDINQYYRVTTGKEASQKSVVEQLQAKIDQLERENYQLQNHFRLSGSQKMMIHDIDQFQEYRENQEDNMSSLHKLGKVQNRHQIEQNLEEDTEAIIEHIETSQNLDSNYIRHAQTDFFQNNHYETDYHQAPAPPLIEIKDQKILNLIKNQEIRQLPAPPAGAALHIENQNEEQHSDYQIDLYQQKQQDSQYELQKQSQQQFQEQQEQEYQQDQEQQAVHRADPLPYENFSQLNQRFSFPELEEALKKNLVLPVNLNGCYYIVPESQNQSNGCDAQKQLEHKADERNFLNELTISSQNELQQVQSKLPSFKNSMNNTMNNVSSQRNNGEYFGSMNQTIKNISVDLRKQVSINNTLHEEKSGYGSSENTSAKRSLECFDDNAQDQRSSNNGMMSQIIPHHQTAKENELGINQYRKIPVLKRETSNKESNNVFLCSSKIAASPQRTMPQHRDNPSEFRQKQTFNEEEQHSNNPIQNSLIFQKTFQNSNNDQNFTLLDQNLLYSSSGKSSEERNDKLAQLVQENRELNDSLKYKMDNTHQRIGHLQKNINSFNVSSKPLIHNGPPEQKNFPPSGSLDNSPFTFSSTSNSQKIIVDPKSVERFVINYQTNRLNYNHTLDHQGEQLQNYQYTPNSVVYEPNDVGKKQNVIQIPQRSQKINSTQFDQDLDYRMTTDQYISEAVNTNSHPDNLRYPDYQQTGEEEDDHQDQV